MIDHFVRRGAEVVTADDAAVHVSGHASAGELQLLIHLLKPRFFVPIHGEYRQLHAHARLARACGLHDDSILLAESGNVIAVSESSIGVAEQVHVGQVFVDADLGEIDWEVLRERRRLAGSGVVVPVIAVQRDTGAVNGYPEIIARGFVPLGDADVDATLEEARQVVARSLEEASTEERGDEGLLRARIQTELKRFLKPRTRRPPLVVPVIVEL